METEYVAAVRTSSGKVENEIDIQVLTNDQQRGHGNLKFTESRLIYGAFCNTAHVY